MGEGQTELLEEQWLHLHSSSYRYGILSRAHKLGDDKRDIMVEYLVGSYSPEW